MEDNYRIVENYGVLEHRENKKTGEIAEVRLAKVAWFGRMPKYELRSWVSGIPKQGVVIGFDESLFKLRDMINDLCKQIEAEEQED